SERRRIEPEPRSMVHRVVLEPPEVLGRRLRLPVVIERALVLVEPLLHERDLGFDAGHGIERRLEGDGFEPRRVLGELLTGDGEKRGEVPLAERPVLHRGPVALFERSPRVAALRSAAAGSLGGSTAAGTAPTRRHAALLD